METIYMNIKNSKTYESHKIVFKLLQRSDVKSSNDYVALD